MQSKVKQRLTEYLAYLGIGQKAFADSVGLSAGFVNSIRVSIQPKTLEKISGVYPELNTSWLLTGEGNMLRENTVDVHNNVEKETTSKVPLFPLDAIGGSLNDFVMSVNKYDCEFTVKPIEGAEFAITVSGDSMAPEYPNGSRIYIKRIKESAFIDWGRVYVLDTCNGVVVKRLVPSEQDTKKFVRCLSINPDPIYAPYEVAWSDIYGVYRVMLCMSVK